VRIAVIGAGKMGVWFAKFFLSKDYDVVLADRKRDKLIELSELPIDLTTNFQEAVTDADQVYLCVSINAIEEVAKIIAPVLHEGQVVMDISSIKEEPINTMKQYIKNSTILGTHPVFGPGSNGVKNKAYILTPTNPKELEFAEKFKNWLEKEDANVFIMTPQKHDELMSIVLGLPHFIGLVACETLLEQKNLPETKKVAGTTYRMLFTLAEATALETPDLYAGVQTTLPELSKIEELFMIKAQELLDMVKRKDTKAIVKRIEQLEKKLEENDSNFTKSYETMYKMLESTEK
jgi:prephenate dehydrogenase